MIATICVGNELGLLGTAGERRIRGRNPGLVDLETDKNNQRSLPS
jgi:hypothetical protein